MSTAAKRRLKAVDETNTAQDPLEALLSFLEKGDARTEMDAWYRADLVLETLAPKLPQATGQGRRSSLARELSFHSAEAERAADDLAQKISGRGLLWDGRKPSGRTLRNNAEAAHIWDRDDRVAGASFGAHFALRSPKYDKNRQAVLIRLVKRSKVGRATVDDVALWRSEQARQKQGPLTFLELFDRRIVRAISAQVRPSFSLTTQEDLDAMAQIMTRRAKQLRQGEQPKESN